MEKNERTPLLRYWTARYLITLFVGLAIVGLITTLWIYKLENQKRIAIARFIAEDISERIVDKKGNMNVEPVLLGFLKKREHFFDFGARTLLLIIDNKKNLVFSDNPIFQPDILQRVTPVLTQKDNVVKIKGLRDREQSYLVKKEIKYNQQTIGWVLIVFPQAKVTLNNEQLQLLIILLVSLALLGWGVIYLLSRKLSKPIKDVVDAAKQIVEGNYDIQMDKDIKEKEIYELIDSFENMSKRLKQLEMMRTELLAGVTHELRTPIASIRGLIQSVRDEVVTGEEATEFLEISIKETKRLQKMVEDLLDFNSMIIGEFKLQKEKHNINELVQEISHQWLIGQENSIELHTSVPDQPIYVMTDSARVQQILYNLLNNSIQAMNQTGRIDVILYQTNDDIRIDVRDNGPGIPEEEKGLIFERFFRGKAKKIKVRGLGLGLTYSKNLAKALGGDLILKETSEKGTTFTLILKNEDSYH
ncbi:HAMP domain-containing sensor histidine kinase [Tepidibacillus sp. LV47]|uniref:HAMP domain-containing sensor histidine kinase n=1 Tax=Tepidibacillus sp. LV47 TaxID=3398228 RepID=UPI003AB0F3B2